MILIKTATYESVKHGKDISIRITLDGGNTYAVANVDQEGEVSGAEEDLKIIAAQIGNLGNIDAYDWAEGEPEMWIRYQTTIDRQIAERRECVHG